MKLGIIAGGGGLPIAIAKENQIEAAVLIDGFADPEHYGLVPYVVLGIHQSDEAISYLRKQEITHIVFAGNVDKPDLSALPKSTSLVMSILNIFNKGDDALLKAVKSHFEKEGFIVLSPVELMKDITVENGFMIGQIDEEFRKDAKLGMITCRKLGELDIGQSCVISGGVVLGVEAVEGTDQLIQRCGSYKKYGKHKILVKTIKPTQDKKMDIPSIGPTTIDMLAKNGYTGISVEANKVIVFSKYETILAAQKEGLIFTAI